MSMGFFRENRAGDHILINDWFDFDSGYFSERTMLVAFKNA